MLAPSENGRSQIYRVPARFGVGAVLGLMTVFALLFAGLRQMEAPPVVYAFFGTLALATGAAQMRYGDVPRMASTLAGAAFLPLWVVISLMVSTEVDVRQWTWGLAALPFLSAAGAFFGYVTGAIVAGIFLSMDWLERVIAPHSPEPCSPPALLTEEGEAPRRSRG